MDAVAKSSPSLETFTKVAKMPPVLPAWFATVPAILLWRLLHRRTTANLNAERILIIRIDGIGDCVLTTPLISELKRDFPDSKISVATRPIAVDVFRGNTDVHDIIVVDMYRGRARMRKALAPIFTALRIYWQYLRNVEYDLVISPRYGTDYDIATLLSALTFAPETVGFADDTSPERAKLNRGYERLFTICVPAQPGAHEAERNLAVAAAITGKPVAPRVPLNVPVADDAVAAADVWMSVRGIRKDVPLIFIGLPAANLHKRWAPERFAEAVRLFAPDSAQVVIATDDENELAANAMAGEFGSRHVTIAKNLPLQQILHMFSFGVMYFGNDSGLAHLAAAAGLPVVVVTNHPMTAPLDHVRSPNAFSPWAEAVRTLRPSHPAGPECVDGCVIHEPHCINVISAEEVAEAARELIARGKVSRQTHLVSEDRVPGGYPPTLCL